MLTLKEANEQLKLSLYTIEDDDIYGFDVDNSKPYVLVESVEMGTMEIDRFESIEKALEAGISLYIVDKLRYRKHLETCIAKMKEQLANIHSFNFNNEV